ncbi:MAG: hypothetical protein WB992_21610 [Bryobacteraceae bacterium]
MAESSVNTLYKDWQRFVKEHACMIRDGRMSGLSREELNTLSEAYVQRIDSAYSRLMQAEQRDSRSER